MSIEYISSIKKHSIGIIVWLILLATAIAINSLRDTNPSLILPIVGVASFAIPIVLSFSDKYNLGTRLDNGELRKSIAISLTVIYIIMLSLFFLNVTLPSFHPENNSADSNKGDAEKIDKIAQVSEDITGQIPVTAKNSLILPLLIEPASAQEEQNTKTNPSSSQSAKDGTETSTEKTGETNAAKTEGAIPAADEPAADKKEDAVVTTEKANGESTDGQEENGNFPQGIPEAALSDIYKSFLYVYILIIGFYFGSRVFEDFAGVRMAKELKDVDSVDLLKRRYAVGEISEEDYMKKIESLAAPADLLRMKFAMDDINKEDYESKIKILEEPVELAFSFDKSKKVIRITNIAEKEICINDILVDGIHAFDKEGKPLKGNTIGAKKHTDIDIKIDGLRDKNNYFIRMVTDSGRVIQEAVIPTDL